jgi:hypothetical protein
MGRTVLDEEDDLFGQEHHGETEEDILLAYLR